MTASDEVKAQQELWERFAFLEAALAERDAKITELVAQVEKPAEKLGQNSKNSHLPPSSDGPGSGARNEPRYLKRPKSGRKRGGQKGHRGSHRALLPVERVDVLTTRTTRPGLTQSSLLTVGVM